MTIHRRGFLAGILASGVAPAFVGAKILMPVKQIIELDYRHVYDRLHGYDVLNEDIIIDAANETWNGILLTRMLRR